jgi:hypothetical protein
MRARRYGTVQGSGISRHDNHISAHGKPPDLGGSFQPTTRRCARILIFDTLFLRLILQLPQLKSCWCAQTEISFHGLAGSGSTLPMRSLEAYGSGAMRPSVLRPSLTPKRPRLLSSLLCLAIFHFRVYSRHKWMRWPEGPLFKHF